MNPGNTRPCRLPKKERGVALVVSLLILIVVTLLGITAMRSANLNTKIAVNHQHKQIAFQAAESGLTKLTVLPADKMSKMSVPGNVGDKKEKLKDPDKSPDDTNYDWWFSRPATDNRPAVKSRLDLELLEISKKYKFSGYDFNITTVIFQADAYGEVEGTNARAHNRMEVALIRD